MSQNMRIATWNSNGIQNRKLGLEAFLKEQNIDVCLISESHLTLQSIVKLRGYKVYNTFHPSNKAKDGTAVIVKDNIIHHEENNIQTNEVQLTVIEIKSTKQTFRVGALYCPPKFSIKKPTFHNIIKNMGERFILGGDYNAKHVDWGSRRTTTRGRALREAAREAGCNFHSTGKPTYWPTDTNKIPDLLDFFITRKISPNFVKIEENFDLNS